MDLDENKMDEAVQKKHGETEKEMVDTSIDQENSFEILNKIRLHLNTKEEELEGQAVVFQQYQTLILKDINELTALVMQPNSSVSEQCSLLDSIRKNVQKKYMIYTAMEKKKDLLQNIAFQLKDESNLNLSTDSELASSSTFGDSNFNLEMKTYSPNPKCDNTGKQMDVEASSQPVGKKTKEGQKSHSSKERQLYADTKQKRSRFRK